MTGLGKGFENGTWKLKICYTDKKSEKREITEGIDMPNQERIRTLGEK